jgi:hypothetical protein
MKLFNVFNKPYPYEDSFFKRFIISLLFGIFVGFFLLLFQPFDIYKIEHNNKNVFILGFGLVTFLAMMITYFFFPLIFKKFYCAETWKIKKEFTHIIVNIILITFLNIAYSIFFCESCVQFHLVWFKVFIFSFLSVLVIGLFPIIFMLIIYQNMILKRNIRNAEALTQTIKHQKVESSDMIIFSVNKKKMLSLRSDQLILIESNGNYINVYYENRNLIKRDIIRNTLKNIEYITTNSSNFIKCHKSYIVNLNKLKKVNGNAQGYKVELEAIDFEIPVSRTLSKHFIHKISERY